MKTYIEIQKEKTEKVTRLIDECRLFFAFNDVQFIEGSRKNPLEPGDRYVSVASGGFMPKSLTQLWIDGAVELEKWERRMIEEYSLQEAEIIYTLENYECWYVGSPAEAIEKLNDVYSPEQV